MVDNYLCSALVRIGGVVLILKGKYSDMASVQTLIQEEVDTLVTTDKPFQLIVWNDEVNTFEWVIETLQEVCGHSHEQAEQCAYIIHFKGKYAVKQGQYEELKPQCDAITERGIGATIEVLAD